MELNEALIISVSTGLVSAGATIAVQRNEIKHIWRSITRHDSTHKLLWQAIGKANKR